MLTEFQLELIKALQKEKAEFVLIGGHAALIYGSDRTTGDMDLLVNPDAENGKKIISAFQSLGLDVGELVPQNFEENLVLSFGFEPDGVDIINYLKALTFEAVASKALVLELLPGLECKVIDAQDLLLEKRLLNRTGRKGLSDQMDILSLEEWVERKGENGTDGKKGD